MAKSAQTMHVNIGLQKYSTSRCKSRPIVVEFFYALAESNGNQLCSLIKQVRIGQLTGPRPTLEYLIDNIPEVFGHQMRG